ncbi:hypothetical protein [Nonomuraea sp. NPDC005692]|uniref:hypothetical protein n=1 Tax=Nonomuraea sp. NPDC005692 TaxID=3157168 RepID=UPI0033D85AA0
MNYVMRDPKCFSSESFSAAARTLASTISEHLDEAISLDDASDSPADVSSREALIRAMRRYFAEYSALTGEDLLASIEEADAGEPEGLDSGGGGTVSILSRIDYHIEDFGQLIEEGRRSYRQIEPDASLEQVNDAVPDLSSAIYEIMHVNGDRIPFPFPSGMPIAGITWFLEVDEAMGKDAERWPDEPFEIACNIEGGELIYRHRDIYHLTAEALKSTGEHDLHLGE